MYYKVRMWLSAVINKFKEFSVRK